MTHSSGSSMRGFATPRWFRFGVIAAAVAVLCSCRSTAPVYRVADAPSYLTGDQVKQAKALPAGYEIGPCESGGCACCSGASAKTTVTPKITHTIRGQSPEQPIAYYPAACPPGGCPTGTCAPGACACCGPDGLPGPRDEWLCDGGDMGAQAAVVKGGNVRGLDLEDAVAHYDTVDGRTLITPSNKVCIYAPRFAAVRRVVDLRAAVRIDAAAGAVRDAGAMLTAKEQHATNTLAAIEPNIHRKNLPPSLLRNRQKAGDLDRDQRVAVTIGTLAPYANLQMIRAGEVVGREKAEIARASLAAITWAGDQAAQVLIDNRAAKVDVGVQTPGTIYLLVEPNNPKLRLVKLASTHAAHPGDEVEFTLRFDNVGDRVIGNVAILDSLTTRLEYVEGSQKCSIDADFQSLANDGGSLKLRWQVKEPLKPGAGGVIQFRCRVR